AGRVARVGRGLAELRDLRQQFALDGDPPLERVLAATAKQILNAACGASGQLERVAGAADLGGLRGLARRLLRRGERLAGRLGGLGGAVEADVDGIAAGALSLRGELSGQLPENGASAL